jgi:hypothetical protein
MAYTSAMKVVISASHSRMPLVEGIIDELVNVHGLDLSQIFASRADGKAAAEEWLAAEVSAKENGGLVVALLDAQYLQDALRCKGYNLAANERILVAVARDEPAELLERALVTKNNGRLTQHLRSDRPLFHAHGGSGHDTPEAVVAHIHAELSNARPEVAPGACVWVRAT